MTTSDEIVVLGAEKQAATSLALAYPECRFLFVSDSKVLDGWDLPNVRFTYSLPLRLELDAQNPETVMLCPRWLKARPQAATNAMNSFALSAVMIGLRRHIPKVLPVANQPDADSKWLVKGDLWHRPDAVYSGSARNVRLLNDPHQCGLVYQSQLPMQRTMLVVGRRISGSRIGMGVFQIHAEMFCREAMLMAGETIDRADLADLSIAVLETIDWRGFFSMNWIETDMAHYLTSIRPVPRAVWQTLRRAGVDLLNLPQGVNVARSSLRFVADYHYSTYSDLK